LWNNGRGRRSIAAGARQASTEHGIRHLKFRRHKLSTLMSLLLALLLAQLGAQAHAYSHLRTGSQQDGPGPLTQACAECCLSAPLLNIVGSAVAVPPARVDTFVIWLAPRALAYLAVFQPPGFRSRAPPASL